MTPNTYYSYALDAEKRLINVEQASKGQSYFCPYCGAVMIPKMGKIRRWHFAHSQNHSCSYETYLHKLAKLKIAECFNNSEKFIISFHPKVTCNIAECPLGVIEHCSWRTKKEFDLKQFYDSCEEEVPIGNFRADLLISNVNKPNIPPILIEIFVRHKSTEEKLESGYRIIEIRIDSEEDIDNIISSSSIIESEDYTDKWKSKIDEHIVFYNFKADSFERPDNKHQAPKFRFWIDNRGYFNFDSIDDYDESIKCLTQNEPEIEQSKLLIESRHPISWDLAFLLLAESGLGIKYCTMCRFYRMNDKYLKSICILYKSKGTKQFPILSEAVKCPHFKQIDYARENRLFDIDYNQERKITIRTHSDKSDGKA